MTTILIVDDDPAIRSLLRRSLGYEGYEVLLAGSGEEGLAAIRERRPDLVILDVMMPGIDGLEVCRRLREEEDVPVLMLTAKRTVSDRVEGLDSGADDYLVKPFALDELLARVRALLRRQQRHDVSAPGLLKCADLELDPATREVKRGDRGIQLTTKEFDLLELFMRLHRRVLRRDFILEQVWGYDFEGESNIVDVYVRYLRAKLEAAGGPSLIHTMRGVGYVLREE